MPAGHKRSYSTPKAFSSRKSARLAPARTTRKQTKRNRPVKRVYTRYRTAPRTRTGANRSAIYTLAKQVKALQNQRYGKLQSHTLFWEMAPPWVLPNNNHNTTAAAYPWCWQLNDFLTPCAMYYGHEPTPHVASFERFGNNFIPQQYNSSDPTGNWNKNRNLELASIHSYKPILSKFTISVNCQLPDAFMPQRMRVTVLKLKPYYASMTQDISLPSALSNYANLALEPGDPQRNYLWKKYHTVLYDKTKIIRNTLDTEHRQFSFSFSHRYGPNEVVSPHMTSSPTGQEVYMNTPVASQIWVLVSWSDPLVATISKVRINRFDVWRDTLGHNESTTLSAVQDAHDFAHGLVPEPELLEPVPEPELEPEP